MTPWFRDDHPERIAALRAEAARWQGTPFFPNSSSPGPRGGVSCQKLVAALYRGAGFCDVEVPDVPMSHARYSRTSLVSEFMANRPEFVAYGLDGDFTSGPPKSGDLLGFRIHRTIHHLGVCLWPGVFVHSIEGLGTCRCSLADATWAKRLAILWRPIES